MTLYRHETASGGREGDNASQIHSTNTDPDNPNYVKPEDRGFTVEQGDDGVPIFHIKRLEDNEPTYYATPQATSLTEEQEKYQQFYSQMQEAYQNLHQGDPTTGRYSDTASQAPELGYNPATVYGLIQTVAEDEKFQRYASGLTPQQLDQIEQSLSPEQIGKLQNVARQFGMNHPDGLIDRQGLLAAITYYPQLQQQFGATVRGQNTNTIQASHMPAIQQLASWLSPQDRQRLATDPATLQAVYQNYLNGKYDRVFQQRGRSDLRYHAI
jgi:hypothetical protein